MSDIESVRRAGDWVRTGLVLLATLILASSCVGCVVAGYSSTGGPFLWPGGLGLVVMLALILFVLRRRR